MIQRTVCQITYCPYFHSMKNDRKEFVAMKSPMFCQLEDVINKLLVNEDLDAEAIILSRILSMKR